DWVCLKPTSLKYSETTTERCGMALAKAFCGGARRLFRACVPLGRREPLPYEPMRTARATSGLSWEPECTALSETRSRIPQFPTSFLAVSTPTARGDSGLARMETA